MSQPHRSVLLSGKSSSGLWISQYGKPLTSDSFSRELPKVTERHLGVPIRPHAFRHVAATSIAATDLEHVNIIRDLLGHATLDMAEKRYNRASGIASCNRLQSIVKDIRKDMPKMGRANQKHSRRRRYETSR
ncbi:tyrosine-type recombinase/integrase [Roseivivax sp. GX 12232]|uniref:tyrosine-type recombinase/integrase n=1 Tax=Roseivivax sp. GX 12232 TaxID=2900547 RepID=UPI00351D45EF